MARPHYHHSIVDTMKEVNKEGENTADVCTSSISSYTQLQSIEHTCTSTDVSGNTDWGSSPPALPSIFVGREILRPWCQSFTQNNQWCTHSFTRTHAHLLHWQTKMIGGGVGNDQSARSSMWSQHGISPLSSSHCPTPSHYMRLSILRLLYILHLVCFTLAWHVTSLLLPFLPHNLFLLVCLSPFFFFHFPPCQLRLGTRNSNVVQWEINTTRLLLETSTKQCSTTDAHIIINTFQWFLLLIKE